MVTDSSDKQGVPGALVRIPQLNMHEQTDVNGFFSFDHIPAGVYDIIVWAAGYERDTTSGVTLKAHEAKLLDIALRYVIREDSVLVISGPPRGEHATAPTAVDIIGAADPPLRWNRLALVGGAEAVLSLGSLVWLHNAWYSAYSSGNFHTFDDNGEWLQMDKAGHAQTAYTTGLISYSMLRWSGVRPKTSVWAGGLTGFAYLTAIEIMDGYSEGWGFSSGDMIANATGSALFISQQLVWGEQRIMPKFGFQRSGYAPYRPELLGRGFTEELIKDYNGQTYWLSVNVASFLRESARFPKWLNVAVGYGANGMTGGHENPVMYNAQGNEIAFDRYRQYYLSFDIDLRKLPVRSRFLRAIFTCISFIKIPAPGIELSQKGVRPLLIAF